MLDQDGADHLAADQGGNARHVALEGAAHLARHQVALAAAALVGPPAPNRHAGLRVDALDLQLAVRGHRRSWLEPVGAAVAVEHRRVGARDQLLQVLLHHAVRLLLAAGQLQHLAEAQVQPAAMVVPAGAALDEQVAERAEDAGSAAGSAPRPGCSRLPGCVRAPGAGRPGTSALTARKRFSVCASAVGWSGGTVAPGPGFCRYEQGHAEVAPAPRRAGAARRSPPVSSSSPGGAPASAAVERALEALSPVLVARQQVRVARSRRGRADRSPDPSSQPASRRPPGPRRRHRRPQSAGGCRPATRSPR